MPTNCSCIFFWVHLQCKQHGSCLFVCLFAWLVVAGNAAARWQCQHSAAEPPWGLQLKPAFIKKAFKSSSYVTPLLWFSLLALFAAWNMFTGGNEDSTVGQNLLPKIILCLPCCSPPTCFQHHWTQTLTVLITTSVALLPPSCLPSSLSASTHVMLKTLHRFSFLDYVKTFQNVLVSNG